MAHGRGGAARARCQQGRLGYLVDGQLHGVAEGLQQGGARGAGGGHGRSGAPPARAALRLAVPGDAEDGDAAGAPAPWPPAVGAARGGAGEGPGAVTGWALPRVRAPASRPPPTAPAPPRPRARAPGRPRARPSPGLPAASSRPLPTSRALAPDSPAAQLRRGAPTTAANQRARAAPRSAPVPGPGEGPKVGGWRRQGGQSVGVAARCWPGGLRLRTSLSLLPEGQRSARPFLGGTVDNKGDRGGRQAKGRREGRRLASAGRSWGQPGAGRRGPQAKTVA